MNIALSRWCAVVRMTSGTRIAGTPAAQSSLTVMAPARQIITSHVASCAGMSSMNSRTAAATTHKRAVVTGNPVRADIEALAAPAARFAGRSGPLKLLVVGGSLGAKVLNETLPQALARIGIEQRPLVVHQTGALQRDGVRDAYAAAGVHDGIEVLPFIDNMAERLAACDLMICRAGAVTVSELCAGGVPAVLVPLIVSTTAHQRDNALFMAQHGAAIHLPQTEMTAEKLASLLQSLDRPALQAMAEKAHALARPRAAARVADEIELLVRPR